MQRISAALTLSIITLATGFLLAACEDSPQNPTASGLKIGSLLPTTGDLASIGQQMSPSVPLGTSRE